MGTVVGRGQVAITVATPRLPAPAAAPDQTSSISPDRIAAPVAVASSVSPVAPKAE
jgi:flagella basal body P-ring formation protein FlgA